MYCINNDNNLLNVVRQLSRWQVSLPPCKSVIGTFNCVRSYLQGSKELCHLLYCLTTLSQLHFAFLCWCGPQRASDSHKIFRWQQSCYRPTHIKWLHSFNHVLILHSWVLHLPSWFHSFDHLKILHSWVPLTQLQGSKEICHRLNSLTTFSRLLSPLFCRCGSQTKKSIWLAPDFWIANAAGTLSLLIGFIPITM